MRVDAIDRDESRLIHNWSPSQASRPSGRFFRLSQLRKLRGCEQVAAVCYRVKSSGIEFLLVRTNSGHWTFPKGKAEPGLTYAQAAALEAYEEAGVHGRMEEASFGRYVRRKRGDLRGSAKAGRCSEEDIVVQAHLCEVSRLEPPQEADRNPTWFSAAKAKRRLGEDRTPDFGAELARVVDRAVSHIRRLHGKINTRNENTQRYALRNVQFIDAVRRKTLTAKASG